MKGWLLSCVVFFGVAVTSASADTITWNFSSGTSMSLGSTSHTFVSDGIGITASSSTDLFSKAGGGDENGLGLTCCDDDAKAVSIMTLYTDMKAHGSGTLTITGITGDVLVDQMEATRSSVPEPSSLLLVGNGIFMLAGAGVVRKALRRR